MKKYRYLIILILLISSIYVWINIFNSAQDKILKVVFFDVGQGDSVFIETPAGYQILIDGGPDAMVLEKLNQQLSFFDRQLDLVITTHPDSDHLTGLVEVLKNFQVDLILTNGLATDTHLYQTWQKLLQAKQAKIKIAQSGQIVDLGQGVELRVLWPQANNAVGINEAVEKTNQDSIVTQLVYGKVEVLLPGDIEKQTELMLAQASIESDVLKIAHHGSRGSTNPLFLQKVNPLVAVISVGQNTYGHPHQEILDRLAKIKVYRTDQNGDLKLLINGQNFNISPDRQLPN